MKLITELTPEQVKNIGEVRQEYLKHYFSFEFDEKTATESVSLLYRWSKNKKPTVILMDSPLGCQVVVQILKSSSSRGANISDNIDKNIWNNIGHNIWKNIRDNIKENINENIWNNIGHNIWQKIEENIRKNIWKNIYKNIWEKISENIWKNIYENIWEKISENSRKNIGRNISANIDKNLWKNLSDNIGQNIRDNIIDNIWHNIGQNIRDNIIDNIGHNIGHNIWENIRKNIEQNSLSVEPISLYGDCHDCCFVAYYDYLIRNNMIKGDFKLFNEYKKLTKQNIFSLICFENVCIISKPPQFIRQDERNRLHCTTDYAIYFKDGYGGHYVHGVFFEAELFKRAFVDNTITAKEILTLGNSEQKAAIIQERGYESIIKGVKDIKIIDEEDVMIKNRKEKYQVIEFEIDKLAVRLVKVVDYSANKTTLLGVPVNIEQTKTCKGAIAWTFGLDTDKYNPVIET